MRTITDGASRGRGVSSTSLMSRMPFTRSNRTDEHAAHTICPEWAAGALVQVVADLDMECIGRGQSPNVAGEDDGRDSVLLRLLSRATAYDQRAHRRP